MTEATTARTTGLRVLVLLPLLLSAACATGQDTLDAAAPALPVYDAAVAPPDLAGHEDDPPHARRVLVPGDTADLDVPGGRVRVRVTGPALVPLPALAAAELPRYRATFTLDATGLIGRVPLGPGVLQLLDLHDQTGAAAPVPRVVPALATDLAPTLVDPGAHVHGTWTALVSEGHGELLYAPAGATPAALWDFRAER